MQNKLRRHSSASATIETLESRTHLCAGTSVTGVIAGAALERSATVAPARVVREITHTTLKVTAGELGRGATFDVVVKTASAFGSPTGTVAIIDHGSTIQTVTLSPIASRNAKFDLSEGTYTIPAGAGGPAYSIGAHHVSATFTSTESQLSSTARGAFVVRAPKYTRRSDGLRVATVETGSGPAIAAGQSATVMYTGYLAKNGSIFDDSNAHTPTTFTFTIEASPEQAITGFDEGTLGMQVGETRVLAIPSKLGYGSQGAGSSVPPNANLVFLVTLVSIS